MISIENVSFGYSKKSEILSGVNAKIERGTVTALVGPNGSGKTTLLRITSGILAQKSGKIFIDGEDASLISRIERAKKIAYLPQTRSIPDVTVSRLVLSGRFPHTTFFHRYKNDDFQKAKESIKKLGIEDLSEKNLLELSGGQRQKAYIAMALSQCAPALLLDEPLTFLDTRQQLELLSLVKNLAAEGKAVLMVIHDLSLALSYADRLIVLSNGKIISDSSPHEAIQNGAIEEAFGVKIEKAFTKSGEKWFFSL